MKSKRANLEANVCAVRGNEEDIASRIYTIHDDANDLSRKSPVLLKLW
ncbi:hypothetical protein [Alteromonas sp. KUL106]|nr:hypothetical protein [Alteromonas sp. KUL106]